MIAFDLKCRNGHVFEGWFEDSRAYETQRRKQLIACPICSSNAIDKIPSTFAIKGTPKLPETLSKATPNLQRINREIVDYVKTNFDNVGCDFAKEALKMHYGVTEPRNIRGVSTKEEEKTLRDEGISFFKIPVAESTDTES